MAPKKAAAGVHSTSIGMAAGVKDCQRTGVESGDACSQGSVYLAFLLLQGYQLGHTTRRVLEV